MFGRLGDNIWDHEIPVRFGEIPLWHRMTIIRLSGGGLCVHSPTKLDFATQEAPDGVYMNLCNFLRLDPS
jgi:hypothetical protein